MLIGLASWRGFENIHDGLNHWTWPALGLASFTLLTAALGVVSVEEGLVVSFTGKLFGVLLGLVLLAYLGRFHLNGDEVRDWLWESWRSVRQIFPLLVVGVTPVGAIRVLIRPEWIEALAGGNTLLCRS